METAFPSLSAVESRSHRGSLVLLAVAGVSAAAGAAFLLVPWPSQSALALMSYPACQADLRTSMGCLAGFRPWLPFALLFGGVGGGYFAVWRMRRG